MIAEYTLQALADGALGKDQTERILQIIEQKPALKEEYRRIKQEKARLKNWWRMKYPLNKPAPCQCCAHKTNTVETA